MTRIISAALVLLSLTLPAGAATRSRAVRHPAPQCTFSLSPGFATTAVASAGLTGGAINVVGSPSTCTSWNAYSLTSWVTITRSGNTALVDVAPNPTNTPRTATLRIAGVRYELTQEGSPVISPPIAGNVVRNAGFDSDLSFWGWQNRFPNGPGAASWASLDARGNPNSGSIRLINTRPATVHAFQQLQCVVVEASAVYEFGGSFFATSSSAGTATFSIVEYADDDCNVAAVNAESETPRIRTPGTWQSETYIMRMSGTTRSVFFDIGSRATEPGTFEVLIDDVFLRKR